MSYPCHWTRYSNFFWMILKSRSSDTSNSSYPSISTRRGSTWNFPGIEDSLYGSSKETWNIGWIFIEGSNSRWKVTSLIYLTTEKGPRRRNSSLSHGQLVLRLRQSSYTLFPILTTECAFQDFSTLSFYRFWTSRNLSFISVWISNNLIPRSPATIFSTLLKSNWSNFGWYT